MAYIVRCYSSLPFDWHDDPPQEVRAFSARSAARWSFGFRLLVPTVAFPHFHTCPNAEFFVYEEIRPLRVDFFSPDGMKENAATHKRTTLNTKARGHSGPSWRKIVHHIVREENTSVSTTSKLREAANARAALHARMEAQRNLHTCSTLPRKMRGSDLAFARARSRRNIRASLDQRPSSCVRPHELRVRRFLLASRNCESRSVNLCSTWSGRAVSVEWSGETSVVSMANSIPPQSGKPSATLFNRRLSWACGNPKFMSLTIMGVVHESGCGVSERVKTVTHKRDFESWRKLCKE